MLNVVTALMGDIDLPPENESSLMIDLKLRKGVKNGDETLTGEIEGDIKSGSQRVETLTSNPIQARITRAVTFNQGVAGSRPVRPYITL